MGQISLGDLASRVGLEGAISTDAIAEKIGYQGSMDFASLEKAVEEYEKDKGKEKD